MKQCTLVACVVRLQRLHSRRPKRIRTTCTSSDSTPSSTTIGQLAHGDDLRRIVDCFPPVLYAIGYGSGVFAQNHHLAAAENDLVSLPMIDLILVIDNAKSWHASNLRRHASHYAGLSRLFGASYCSALQTTAAGVWFHPLVSLQDQEPESRTDTRATSTTRRIKYGVVEHRQVVQDLQHWKYLYVAGRLQKPTVLIEGTDCMAVQDSMFATDQFRQVQNGCNLLAALAAALLQLGQEPLSELQHENTIPTLLECTLETLYEQIAQLSYAGDLRMSVGGEDPNKIRKLVHSEGQLQRFHDLYRDAIDVLHQQGAVSRTDDHPGTIQWNPEESQSALWQKLPGHVRQLTRAEPRRLTHVLKHDIVGPVTRRQIFKGVLSAGIARSARYAAAKLAKGWG